MDDEGVMKTEDNSPFVFEIGVEKFPAIEASEEFDSAGRDGERGREGKWYKWREPDEVL